MNRRSKLLASALVALVASSALPAAASGALAWHENVIYTDPRPNPPGIAGIGRAAVGDVTGDGLNDVVVNHYGLSEVIVIPATAPGTYGPPLTTALPATFDYRPISLAVLPLDGDAYADVVVGTSGHLLSFRGNADGTLSNQVIVRDKSAFSIVPMNADGDAKTDIATVDITGSVAIGTGNGDRTFTFAATRVFPPHGFAADNLGVGDLDGGFDDVVTAQNYLVDGSSATLNAYVASGGSYNHVAGPAEPIAFASAVIGSFDSDVYGDVLAGQHDTTTDDPPIGKVNLYAGNGAGGLTRAATMFADGDVEDIVAGDFDLDGRTDAMATVYGIRGDFPRTGRFPSSLNWIRNTPAGLEVRPVSADEPYSYPGIDIVAGQMNGDGFLDFVQSGFAVSVYESYDDTVAPTTTLTVAGAGSPKSPAKGKPVRIKFEANEDGSAFTCKVDRKPSNPCRSPLKLKGLRPGKHVVRVSATDLAGNNGKSRKAKFAVQR